MYYNRIILCGKVLLEPTIRTGKNGKNFVASRIGFKKGTNKNVQYTNFNLAAYGESGNELLEKVKVGDFICVIGTLSASGYKSAKEETGVNLNVMVTKWQMEPATEMAKQAEKEMLEGGPATEESANEEFLF